MEGSGSGLETPPGIKGQAQKGLSVLGSSSLLTGKEMGGCTSLSINHQVLMPCQGFLCFNSSCFQGPRSNSQLLKTKQWLLSASGHQMF